MASILALILLREEREPFSASLTAPTTQLLVLERCLALPRVTKIPPLGLRRSRTTPPTRIRPLVFKRSHPTQRAKITRLLVGERSLKTPLAKRTRRSVWLLSSRTQRRRIIRLLVIQRWPATQTASSIRLLVPARF